MLLDKKTLSKKKYIYCLYAGKDDAKMYYDKMLEEYQKYEGV